MPDDSPQQEPKPDPDCDPVQLAVEFAVHVAIAGTFRSAVTGTVIKADFAAVRSTIHTAIIGAVPCANIGPHADAFVGPFCRTVDCPIFGAVVGTANRSKDPCIIAARAGSNERAKPAARGH